MNESIEKKKKEIRKALLYECDFSLSHSTRQPNEYYTRQQSALYAKNKGSKLFWIKEYIELHANVIFYCSQHSGNNNEQHTVVFHPKSI